MNIDEIRAEIPMAFEDWDTLSASLIGCGLNHDREWPDFPLVGIYVLALVNKAYEAGISESGKKLYEHGFEEAAKDPKAWYVLDKNGEHIHGGDTVSNAFGDRKVNYIFYKINNTPCVKYVDGGWDFSQDIEKVIPDTREKIKEELSESFVWDGEDIAGKEDALKLAEIFISRIEALGE